MCNPFKEKLPLKSQARSIFKILKNSFSQVTKQNPNKESYNASEYCN